MSKLNPSTMKGPGDFSPPDPEPDAPECPECGGEMEETDSGTYRGREWATFQCCDEDCDGYLDGEPDWEAIMESRRGY